MLHPFQPVYLPGGTPVPGNVPQHRPPIAFQPVAPTTAGLAAGVVPAAPQPKFRAQTPDPVPAAPARLVMPAPEELGIGSAKMATMPVRSAAPIDWNQAHQRLKEIGAVGFHLDRTRTGQVRATFWLPTAEPGRTQLVEATAACEADAVHAALHQAHAFQTAMR